MIKCNYYIPHLMLIVMLFAYPGLGGISNADLRFLTDKEQFLLLEKYSAELATQAQEGSKDDLQAVLEYAEQADKPELAMQCHKRLALQERSLEDALQWLLLFKASKPDSLQFDQEINLMVKKFAEPLEQVLILQYAYGGLDTELQTLVDGAETYNSVIEAAAKDQIDEISITQTDSLALSLIDDFAKVYPKSKYLHIALYYKLYHLSNQKDWQGVLQCLQQIPDTEPVLAYLSTVYLASPTLRKNCPPESKLLELAVERIKKAYSPAAQTFLSDQYTAADWNSRVSLQKAKLSYYQILQDKSLFGDEETLSGLEKLPKPAYRNLLARLDRISFSTNDRGEKAELEFWRGKAAQLSSLKSIQLKAAKHFTNCLILGSPRKKYDDDALKYITQIQQTLKIKLDPLNWMRKLKGYKGITFADYSDSLGVANKPYSRVALGDYNHDGKTDILFSGKYLYQNNGSMHFSDVSAQAGLSDLDSAGGIFADFNKDGKLDLVSYSHAEDGNGDKLLKNMDDQRFVNVNERAGDIDDKFPTESVAWVDTENSGFPSLYAANYEKWNVRSGYPDYFWQNQAGYFADASQALGFRTPDYTDNPGQAGRGVSPADYNNDGKQEILVCNYRLNRNFLWQRQDTLFVDAAALNGVAGKYKKGYYGHSIGADWGDYDNDGDLDLFIANLAHPRYLDISDVSMLLRNDGLAYKVVEGDTIHYWQFTDVTRQAGITYDELHSDPLFFDADNDGWLDLFITSVYPGERSYLYRNKGDGTFEDITWLSGARVYNGWGNASADLDRDGLPDLVVGSGSGARVLKNTTVTKNRSLTVKPVWKGDQIILETDPQEFGKLPNSPAYGTRVLLYLKGKKQPLVRELCSAKGTGSQNAQELLFGIGKSKVAKIVRFQP